MATALTEADKKEAADGVAAMKKLGKVFDAAHIALEYLKKRAFRKIIRDTYNERDWPDGANQKLPMPSGICSRD
ncbi:MAG: hypothetical protein CMJ78_22695 [Planctomycetaceae bacterium]|nr:hypothetical protein [Planctomycetaceae bacterium]